MMLAAMTRLPWIALLALIACTAVVVVLSAARDDSLGLEADPSFILVIAALFGLVTVGPVLSVRRSFKRRQEELPTLRDEMEESRKQKESERDR